MTKSVLRLIRFKIALMVGLSAFAGGLLFTHHINHNHVYGVFGAIFLSFGCSALNQYQERERDSLMQRTKKRPLPSACMLPYEVLRLSIVLLLLAFCFIALTESGSALILSMVTVTGYNFIYTPVKVKTPFALLIGSVIGSLPPAIGYCAAGGDFIDTNILIVTAVLYLWQTPHFAVLAEKYADDYAKAGFKTISSKYGLAKSTRFINVWIVAYVCALLFVPVSGLYKSETVSVIHGVMTIVFCMLMLFRFKNTNLKFHYINLSAVLFFFLMMSDRIISK